MITDGLMDKSWPFWVWKWVFHAEMTCRRKKMEVSRDYGGMRSMESAVARAGA